MSELSKKEFWLISVYFYHARGFGGSHSKHDIWHYMSGLCCYDADDIVESLVQKNVLSQSPDGYKVKFTDYGIELFNAMKKEQDSWDSKNIINISNIKKDEILIRAGERFKANRIIRELINSAKRELYIMDPYIGSDLLDQIEDTNTKINIRILTSDQTKKTVRQAYFSYSHQYKNVEIKILPFSETSFHDRFIFIDSTQGFHLGHSLKDMGTKDTQINKIKDITKQKKMFDDYWSKADSI